MNFARTEILWFLPFVVLPIIIYLLRRIFAPKKVFPSLVFFEEKAGYKKPLWAEILSVFLKSCVVLALILYFAQPIINTKHNANFCIVDDIARTGLTRIELTALKRDYYTLCGGRFHSAASMERNVIEEVSLPVRNQPVWYADILRLHAVLLKNRDVLIFAAENTYDIALGKLPNVFYVPLRKKSNNFFRVFRSDLNPISAETTEYLTGFAGKPDNFTLARKNSRTAFAVKTPEHFSFELKNSGSLEIAEMRISGDENVSDNIIFFPILQPLKIGLREAHVSPVFMALSRISTKEFPGYRITNNTESENAISYQVSTDASCLRNCIILHRRSSSDQIRYLESPSLAGKKAGFFSAVATLQSAKVVSLNFTDGSPAIYRDRDDNIRISFDPDAVAESVMKSSQYPYEVLSAVIKAAMKTQVHFVTEESELLRKGFQPPSEGIQGTLLRYREKATWIQRPVITEPDEVPDSVMVYLPNPLASQPSGLPVPDEKVFRSGGVKPQSRLHLLPGFAFLLMGLILLLDFGHSPAFLQRKNRGSHP